MRRATFYDPVGGRIIGTLICSETYFDVNVEDKTWIEGTYDLETHYIADGIATLRPAMPLSVSGTTITGIPAGSVLALGEQTFEVDDGEADITGYSGAVKITCWPYLDAEVVI